MFVSWRPPTTASYAYLLGCVPRRRVLSRRRADQLVITARHWRTRRSSRSAAARSRPASLRTPRRHSRPHREFRTACASTCSWTGLARGVPAARAGPQARAADRARGLAAGDRRRAPVGVPARASCTRTAAGRSTASRPSCRAGGSPSTSIRASSSRTCRPTSAGSSARRASRSACAGRSPTTATSRSRTAQRRAAGRARGAEDVTAYHERPCGRGGIGRHAGLRSRCRKAWGFESLRPHPGSIRHDDPELAEVERCGVDGDRLDAAVRVDEQPGERVRGLVGRPGRAARAHG